MDRRLRPGGVIAVAIVTIAIVAVVYIKPFRTSPASTQSARATPSTHAATTLASPADFSCPATELKLTGVFEECAAIDKAQSCLHDSTSALWIVRLHGTKHDFLLYVELNGVYRGPGLYAIDTLADNVAKVEVRDYITGRLWESSAGTVSVDAQQTGGWVYAGLGPSSSSPVQVELNIAGWWSCS